jgi:hypothetical protein
MRVSIIYIYPNNGEGGFHDKAVTFLETYHQHPPGMDHKTVIVCNGVPANDETRFLFASMPNVEFLNHDNSGLDCGGYQAAARSVDADLLVFFGSTTYFKRAGWMLRMVQAYEKHGDCLYGTMGNQGHQAVGVWPHVRTTAFWMSRNLFNRYPIQVTRNEQRYAFEHGVDGLTSWVLRQAKKVLVVTWEGEYSVQLCDGAPGGFHNGAQENLLVGDRLSCPPYYACA